MVELISVHIPKTAGTAFGRIFLPEKYEHKHILYDYKGLPAETIFNSLDPQTKVIHGHFHASKYKNHFPSAKLITWLRHPFSILVSWYCFWKSVPENQFANSPDYMHFIENKLSFQDFIVLPYVINLLNKYISEIDLLNFYFIGIQEFFDEDIKDLKDKLDFKSIDDSIDDITVTNRNPDPNYQVFKERLLRDNKSTNMMESLNSKDIDIFKEALCLREKRRGTENSLSYQQLYNRLAE